MVRRNGSMNQHRPGKRQKAPRVESHYHSQSRKKARVTTNEKICSFCGKTGHIKGPKCLAWTPFQPFFCKPDDKTELTSRLGEPSLHKFVMCPPAVESEVKLREGVEQSQPWPLDAQHMVLVKAYYDFDIVHHSTRFGPDP